VRKFRLRTLRRLALFLLLAVMVAIILRWISLEKLQRNPLQTLVPITPTPTPEISPTPPKPPVIVGKLDTARLWNGITVHAAVDPTQGKAASEERGDPQSYVLDLALKVRVPAPNQTADELAKVSPQLTRLLPGLVAMTGPEAVSPLFKDLYDAKVRLLRENLVRLDQLLSRHNFYDCQTILQLTHAQSKRRALLLQADMDVDADGSDADRLPNGVGTSPTFKPFTSYRWNKKTPAPNPFLASAEEKLRRFEAEFALKGLTPERNHELRLGIQGLRDEVDSLKRFSFLIAATDPYIVLPGVFARAKNAGKIGDYALVLFGDQIYPAIVGDVGPSDKVGEASLRIAKEINALATPNNRPVSDLKVTYLIFPGTAESPFGPPDLEKIQARCQALADEFGGVGVPLHHWENLIPPPPTPTPTPVPTPTPTPTPSATLSPTASPSPAVSPTFAFPTASPTTETSAAPSSSPAAGGSVAPGPR
jgi:hypothetical protein